jgi:flagellar hook-associated protein 1 FlgK
MAGLSLTLDTAEQALINTQLELQTSSNNISNASNTWYAREVAVQTSNPDVYSTSGWIGDGASVTQIMQMRSQYLDGELLNATSANSQYTSLASQLQSIQSAASDSGSTGISEALGNFFDAWDSLSTNPTGLSEQTNVYQDAQNLASTIQSTYSQLNQIATNGLPTQIQDTVSQANTLIGQIAELNASIAQSNTVVSGPANSLIDQRYEAMDNLSKLIPVSFSTQSNGTITVTATDGNSPVEIVSGANGTDISSSWTFTGGQLGGLQQAQTDLQGYMDRLNTFAASLASNVKGLYTATGESVFSVTQGSEASTIAASNTFLNGGTAAAISSCATNVANLQGTELTFSDGKEGTLENYLSDVQEQIGNDLNTANTNATFNQSLQTELQNQQQSYSGVSLDEEMVNVIQYQQIYQAAAKVVSTASTLMSTVISMVQ